MSGLAITKRRSRFGSIEVRATWLTLGLFVVVAGLWGVWAAVSHAAPPPSNRELANRVFVNPVLVPAALTSARAIEVDHLDEFAALAGFWVDWYLYLADDAGARADKLEALIPDLPPGYHRDRMVRRLATYRAREELNGIRSELAEHWAGKIAMCSSTLASLPTE